MGNILKMSTFKGRLIGILFLVFVAFATVVMLFQYEREKEFKREKLETTLDNITILTHNFIEVNNLIENKNINLLDSLQKIVPHDNIRITIIRADGVVIYDNSVADVMSMENHKERPEIMLSVANGNGSNVRKSATTGDKYYYYSKFYNTYFVRTALLYDVEVTDFLKAERHFVLFVLILFIITYLVLIYVVNRMGTTVTRLNEFVVRLSRGERIMEEISFPEDEIGEISNQIVQMYDDLKKAKDLLSIEREKLFAHLLAVKEGVAFFAPTRAKILANNHFVQYLNVLADVPTISVEKIFEVKEAEELIQFLNMTLKSPDFIVNNQPVKEITVSKNGKYFQIKAIVFQDRSFEIVINDVTKLEKRSLMKQQMTSNIAHELKTPVASISGYLETLLSNNISDNQKKRYFLERAYSQAQRLKELIDDIAVLNKIDEARDFFPKEDVNLFDLVNEVRANLLSRIEEKSFSVNIEIPSDLTIHGNRSLLFSIFYNLFSNSLKYAGQGIKINISNYLDDENFVYFSYMNSGNQIPEEHLGRIFERFYRIDSGRSRQMGGTGLGLAIVKNAVQMHSGDISARNVAEGGVEFLFHLKKSI